MGFSIIGGVQGVNTLSVPSGWDIMEDAGIGGIQEGIPGEGGPIATVKFKVNNSDERYSFVNQLLGQYTGAPPSNVTLTAPYAYPPSPQLLCTAVTSIECLATKKPMLGVGLPWWFGRHAIVTAQFTRPPWQQATNLGYFSVNFSGGGEIYQVPETTTVYSNDGTATNTPIGLPIPHAVITITRYRFPFIPDSVCVPLLQRVNSTPFSIGYNTYAAGTLLFDVFSSEQNVDPLGNLTFTVQYVFRFRWIPWNYGLHPNGTSGWVLITDRSSNPLLPSADFSVLP